MRFNDVVSGMAVAGATAMMVTAPPPVATDLDTGSDLTNALVDTHRDVADALEDGVRGKSEGEDSAAAEKLREPDAAEVRDRDDEISDDADDLSADLDDGSAGLL